MRMYIGDCWASPAKTSFGKPEALKGYRVLSCTQYILGPSCASYLAELGAEVIKIEAPRRGEAMRHTTPFNEPFLYPLSRWIPERGTGLGFFGANPNEYFISLDFHRPEGQAILKKLAAKSDVVAENYRPGTFDRWGIGYRQLKEINPRLVYCWMGGFGGWGPGRVRASYDILGQAQGGNFGMTGKQEFLGGAPAKHTIWLADYWGGMKAPSSSTRRFTVSHASSSTRFPSMADMALLASAGATGTRSCVCTGSSNVANLLTPTQRILRNRKRATF